MSPKGDRTGERSCTDRRVHVSEQPSMKMAQTRLLSDENASKFVCMVLESYRIDRNHRKPIIWH